MTEITRWRGDRPRKHRHLPLPEPPRSRKVSRTATVRTDARTRVFEDWLRELTVARTIDAD